MKKSLTQFGSILLLLIFSAIHVIPALHSHPETVTTVETFTTKKISNHPDIDKHTDDCLICSFVAHKQLDFPQDLSAPVISAFACKPITLNTRYCLQFFEAAVHTWTNKGPPAL